MRLLVSLSDESKHWVDSIHLLLEAKISGKDTYYAEKFESIRTQFRERDVRTDQTANQVKLAVDAALQAQKEAAGEQAKSFGAATTKSETAMNKQIEGLDGKITDVKDRLNRVEATSLGASYNRSDSNQEAALRQHGAQNIISTIATIASVMAVLISLGVAIYTVTRQAPEVHVTGSVGQQPQVQRQSFPLVPPWENNLYMVEQQ
jgi:hypothetical protein